MSSLGDLAKAVGQLLGQLMSGGGGGGGGAAATPTTGTVGCVSGYYSESTTPYPSDPCAYYVAPAGAGATSSTDQTSQSLLDALNGSNTGNLLSGLTGSSAASTTINNTNTNSNTNIDLNSDISTATTTGTFNPLDNEPATGAGPTGYIATTSTSATFISNQVQGNSETSSFLGGNTLFGFVGTLVNRWCGSRPWASGFIAAIIPPAFFDGLCQAGGFGASAPIQQAAAASPSAYVSQTPAFQGPSPVQQVLSTTTSAIPARVDIWAVPPSVPLGSRTTIFWNTENATNCTETSPDGSFSQSSLSGGAATVPLTEPTTYTISCLDSGENPVTNYVTVTIGD